MERTEAVEQWGTMVGLLGEEEVVGRVELKRKDGN